MKYCLDASSLICLWHERYPMETFPSLYLQLRGISERMVILESIGKEIKEEKEMVEWLKEVRLLPFSKMTQKDEEEALNLINKYESGTNKKDISQADVKLIAFAKRNAFIVVSEEAKQFEPPKNLGHYKIPLICQKEKVRCINLLKFLQENKIIVG